MVSEAVAGTRARGGGGGVRCEVYLKCARMIVIVSISCVTDKQPQVLCVTNDLY